MSRLILILIVMISLATKNNSLNTYKERGIHVLDESNINTAIKENQLLFILFYNDSEDSRILIEDYQNSLKYFSKNKEEMPFLAKIKITSRNQMEELKIGKVPSFRLYTDKEPNDFSLVSEGDIIFFFQKVFKLMVPIQKFESLDILLNDKPEFTLTLLYIGELNGKIFEKYYELTKDMKDILYLTCDLSECYKKYNGKGLVLIKNFKPNPENKLSIDEFQGMTREELKDWVMNNSLAHVMNLNSIFVDAGIMKKGLGFIFFRNNTFVKRRAFDKVLKKLSKIFPEIAFYSSDIKGSENIDKLAKYFMIKQAQLPLFALYDLRSGDVHSYEYPKEQLVTFKNVKDFINSFYAGTINRSVLSQSIESAISDQEKYAKEHIGKSVVKPLVRDNFADEVIENSKDVLVNFYTEWCDSCHEFMPFYENLAQYMSQNPDLVFTKIDMSKNTVDGTRVSEFPTFKFYPGLAKSSPVEYQGNAIHAQFAEFIKENANNTVVIPQIVYDREDDL